MMLSTSPPPNPRIHGQVLIFLIKLTFVCLLCGSSYLAGSLWGRQSIEWNMHAPMSVGNMMQGNLGSTIETKRSAVDCQKLEEELIEIQVKEELAKHNKISDAAKSNNNDMKPQDRRFPKTMEKFANGIARVNKDKLGDFFDFGNPLSKGKGTGQEDALIIYHSKGALPTDESVAHSVTVNDGNGIPLLEPQTDRKSVV